MNAPARDETADLRAALRAAWARSDRLFGMLSTEALLDRPIGLRHPFLFYMGHLPAFLWNQVSGVLGLPSEAPALDALFERGIDPLSAECAEAASISAWPDLAEVLAYRDRIRRWTLDEGFALLAAGDQGDPLVENLRVLHLALEHEVMHHETLLYMFAEQPRKSRGDLPRAVVGGAVESARPVEVPAGTARIGAEFDAIPFGWDNEFPVLETEVDAFVIDSLPVTVGEWAEFVADGGPVPHNWVEDDGFAVRSMFEQLPIGAVSGWPVQVSQAQATAYADWRGGRLATEAQLHRAAYGAPDGGRREYPWGNAAPTGRGVVDFASWSPQPVGRFPSGASAWGVQELVGNGWEWTGTVFGPLPGFSAWARTYPGYSADFFDEQHFVVFGGSWATDRRLLRRSFRNWYQGHYPYVFSSFRLVR